MKTYKQAPIPADSAWDRVTWRRYAPYWFIRFVKGIDNLIKWLPVIWKDRDWDDYYIYEVLKFKLLKQRNYLVACNRTTETERLNRDITICLNLIERFQTQYYSLEYQDFVRYDESQGILAMEVEFENFAGMFEKYPLQTKKTMKQRQYPTPLSVEDKHSLAFLIAQENQRRCHKLLHKILEERLDWWWD